MHPLISSNSLNITNRERRVTDSLSEENHIFAEPDPKSAPSIVTNTSSARHRRSQSYDNIQINNLALSILHQNDETLSLGYNALAEAYERLNSEWNAIRASLGKKQNMQTTPPVEPDPRSAPCNATNVTHTLHQTKKSTFSVLQKNDETLLQAYNLLAEAQVHLQSQLDTICTSLGKMENMRATSRLSETISVEPNPPPSPSIATNLAHRRSQSFDEVNIPLSCLQENDETLFEAYNLLAEEHQHLKSQLKAIRASQVKPS